MPHLITHEKRHCHPLYNKARNLENAPVHEKDKTEKVQTYYDANKNEVTGNTMRPKPK